MKIYDVTVAISESVPIYKGDPEATVTGVKRLAAGDSANVSQICCGVHTGTHVDAPNHFIDGTRRAHELDLQKLMGACRVVEIASDVIAIEPKHLPPLAGIERILFKTRNSTFWSTPEDGFRTDFAFIMPRTATELANAGVKLVGIDYLSIEAPGAAGHPVHITLLEKEIVILEGLDLRNVSAGDYEMICLPLKYIGGTGDGAPARTVLIEH